MLQRVWRGLAPTWRWRWVAIHRRRLYAYPGPESLVPTVAVDLPRARLCDAGRAPAGAGVALCVANSAGRGGVTLAAESEQVLAPFRCAQDPTPRASRAQSRIGPPPARRHC